VRPAGQLVDLDPGASAALQRRVTNANHAALGLRGALLALGVWPAPRERSNTRSNNGQSSSVRRLQPRARQDWFSLTGRILLRVTEALVAGLEAHQLERATVVLDHS
jgi:hypothetical protein